MQTSHTPHQLRQFARIAGVLMIGCMLVCAGLLQATEPGDPEVVSRIPAKVQRYVERLIQNRDLDADGRLTEDEWLRMSGDPARMDLDKDQVVTREELLLHVARYGLARIPVRLRPPSEGTLVSPAVILQPPQLEVGEPSGITGEESPPPAEVEGDNTP